MQEQATKNVNLWRMDKQIVDAYAKEKGLNFSAALRMIIREWYEKQAKDTTKATPCE